MGAAKDVIGLFVAGGGEPKEEEKKEEAPPPEAEAAPEEAPEGGKKKKKKKKTTRLTTTRIKRPRERAVSIFGPIQSELHVTNTDFYYKVRRVATTIVFI